MSIWGPVDHGEECGKKSCVENELYSKKWNQAGQPRCRREKVEKILDLEYIFDCGSNRFSWWIGCIM